MKLQPCPKPIHILEDDLVLTLLMPTHVCLSLCIFFVCFLLLIFLYVCYSRICFVFCFSRFQD